MANFNPRKRSSSSLDDNIEQLELLSPSHKKRRISLPKDNNEVNPIETIFTNKYDIQQCIEIFKILNESNKINQLISKDINKLISEYATGDTNKCTFCQR